MAAINESRNSLSSVSSEGSLLVSPVLSPNAQAVRDGAKSLLARVTESEKRNRSASEPNAFKTPTKTKAADQFETPSRVSFADTLYSDFKAP